MVNSGLILHNIIYLPQIVFEVTDACNLRCKYCGYGGLYEGYDKREDKFMAFEVSKSILDYLFNIWKSNCSRGICNPVTIGFYGGEPLLNMPLVRDIVDYVGRQGEMGKKFFFNMTTNAMLLDRYVDYLVEHEFRLLISLDGDKEGQGYRVDANGNNSFDRVISNIKLLQTKYPDYFDKFVMFNSVLHNKNSVELIYHFIRNTFGKEPSISPLNNSGVRYDKIDEFKRTYKNITDSIEQASDCEALKAELFVKNPATARLLDYLYYSSGNVYSTYNSLLINPNTQTNHKTGTCTPFSKKMFVTVNGKILQCERIHHNYTLGTVDDKGVHLDYDYIAERHNLFTNKFVQQCNTCANRSSCKQCVYQVDDLLETSTKCKYALSIEKQRQLNKATQLYLRKHPNLYNELLTKAVIR